ncbi:hypothetical protein RhiirA5_359995 [Rhizophagus irregularis]|uniref:Uncharacterized protein n=2 Tax=Rhizophagus irregularis TaxID=588596 RepID=A0A2N0PIN7_9GLOM|nr:hypothetical protein RhiirA5_359995 [Rhizophagus irregularis]PKC69181.1 hypothetical protein RhiirA1_415973 [Rhizophagus irregularis]GBC42621.1 hypothetical protein RIR_e75333_A0A2N0PIN7_9GLOM [Rhizophagus irregularis DAOM 181602=DAOM 197198]
MLIALNLDSLFTETITNNFNFDTESITELDTGSVIEFDTRTIIIQELLLIILL